MALYDSVGQTASVHDLRAQTHRRGGRSAVLFSALAATVDIGVIIASSAVSTLIYRFLSGVEVDLSRSRESALAISAMFVTLAIRDGAYWVRSLALPKPGWIASKWLISLALFLAIAFLFKSGAHYSRGVLLILAPVGFVALLTGRHVVSRILFRAMDNSAVEPLRLAVIGESGHTEGLVRDRIAEDPHLEVASFIDVRPARLEDAVRDALRLSQNGDIDEILIALPWARMDEIERIVAQLRQQALPVLLLPDVQSMNLISRPVQLGALPTFELKRAALNRSEMLMKRILDLTVACVALLFLWPVMLAAAIAIKLETPGPVFFRQRRHGFNNREFHIYKFRSMRVTEDGPQIRQAVRNDPRITRIGAFLRRTSIDELPQLLNVVRGEMSIVGPRPHAVAHNLEWMKQVENYACRHNILPGITGLAQVSGLRGETDSPEKIDGRVRLDLAYIEKWSIGLDIKIILMTAAVLFFQKQAY